MIRHRRFTAWERHFTANNLDTPEPWQVICTHHESSACWQALKDRQRVPGVTRQQTVLPEGEAPLELVPGRTSM